MRFAMQKSKWNDTNGVDFGHFQMDVFIWLNAFFVLLKW